MAPLHRLTSRDFTAKTPQEHRGFTVKTPQEHRDFTAESPWFHRAITVVSPRNHRGFTAESPWFHRGITAESPWKHRQITAQTPCFHRENTAKPPWFHREITVRRTVKRTANRPACERRICDAEAISQTYSLDAHHLGGLGVRRQVDVTSADRTEERRESDHVPDSKVTVIALQTPQEAAQVSKSTEGLGRTSVNPRLRNSAAMQSLMVRQ